MPDDPHKTEDPDARARTQVDIDNAEDVRYWTERFGVSEEELRKAVEEVGNAAEAVARRFEKNWLP